MSLTSLIADISNTDRPNLIFLFFAYFESFLKSSNFNVTLLNF